MTNEQRESINRLEELVKLRKDKTNTIKHDTCICGTRDLDTVLSVLKEKDAEIEEKDKQIDLMANYIVNLIKYNNPEEIREVEEIKQYFERKVEDVKDKRC